MVTVEPVDGPAEVVGRALLVLARDELDELPPHPAINATTEAAAPSVSTPRYLIRCPIPVIEVAPPLVSLCDLFAAPARLDHRQLKNRARDQRMLSGGSEDRRRSVRGAPGRTH